MKTLLALLLSLTAATLVHAQPQRVDAKEVVGPDNSFHDAVMNVAFKFPAGWDVQGGSRWGIDQRENTFMLRPIWPLSAQPSIYYQKFRPDAPRPANVNEWLLEKAREKEASRQKGMRDYRNDPNTLVVRWIAGRPGLSYLATFTRNGQKMAEYNVRVVGEKAYVMFFTVGPAEDVLAVRNDIDIMAESVEVP